MAKVTTLQSRVCELVDQHGGLRQAARVLQTDAGYLSRLAMGEKTAPGPVLLRRLGLRKVVTYERLGDGPLVTVRRPSKEGDALGGSK